MAQAPAPRRAASGGAAGGGRPRRCGTMPHLGRAAFPLDALAGAADGAAGG